MRDLIRLALLILTTQSASLSVSKLGKRVNRVVSLSTTLFQVPQQALGWSFRANKLIQQILEPHPDIVCLQEVNRYGTAACRTMQIHGCWELLK